MWALRFEGVTKRYGPIGYRSLRAELGGRSRAEPAASPASGGNGRRLALDEVSFEVGEGEALGIIGPNGAGKSTALRVAARITAPSSGLVRLRGRVGAIIEVGAGIHPELTGRENIRLYGAILGLRRREIARRFDAIADFAELGAVLDRPVKHYSSGMQLRLGFAIASGVEPDILVVDEALAVGDARFQVRCLQRMAELVRGGTTILYVSHDLQTVQATCRRALLLLDGRLAHEGPAGQTIDVYLRSLDGDGPEAQTPLLTDGSGRPRQVFAPGDDLVVTVPLPALPPGASEPIAVALGIRDGHAWNVLGSAATFPAALAGRNVRCHVRSLPLRAGAYQVWVAADATGSWRRLAGFRVEEPDREPLPHWLPAVAFDHHWECVES